MKERERERKKPTNLRNHDFQKKKRATKRRKDERKMMRAKSRI